MIESGSRPTGGVGQIKDGILSFGGTHVSKDGYIDTSKAKYIPTEYHQKNLTTATKINDLLLVKDGATTGKIAIIQKSEHENQNINEHVFLMRLKEGVNSVYLLSYLKSSFGNMQIKREITGATVTGLTKDVVNDLKIPLPPLEKQNQIAEHIGQIRERAKQLQLDAKTGLEKAKQEVETMILGSEV
jgi:restriction endonuclease S subunit